jgi:hypothetical protein
MKELREHEPHIVGVIFIFIDENDPKLPWCHDFLNARVARLSIFYFVFEVVSISIAIYRATMFDMRHSLSLYFSTYRFHYLSLTYIGKCNMAA